MKLKLPLPDKETQRGLLMKSDWTNDQTNFFYAMKDLSQKHPYYWIEVETDPFTILIDTLGRWMWGLRVKDIWFYGAVKLEANENGCEIYIPENSPQQVKDLLEWCIKKLEESKKEKKGKNKKEKKNDSNNKKQKRRKV
jgi:hypothetical protein